MRLFIYVEGQEEEMFVNRVLREYLRPFGVIVQKPILAATSFRLGSNEEEEVTVGGVTNYNAIRQDILNLFENAEIGLADILTTFVDLYALPHSFPGAEETRLLGIVGAKKSKHIEAEWQKDIGRPNFHPYIQVHEFEALILTRPSVLKDYYPEHSLGITELCLECESFTTPEEINESKDTSPSHRILKRVPRYTKIDGFRHLQEIGIAALKDRCPRFRSWLEQCEKSFRVP